MANYIPPDYSEAIKAEQEHPEEDEVLEEMLIDEEDDIKAEKLLDEQAVFNDNLQSKEDMSSNGSTPPWGSSSAPWTSGNNQPSSTPWQNSGTPSPWNRQQNSGGSSWSSGWGSGWNNNNNNQQNNNSAEAQQIAAQAVSQEIGHRDIVVIDMIDGLIESYTSEGKPNVFPRAVYDMKFKLDVWDRIASLSPKKVCILLPPGTTVPAFSINSVDSSAAIEYLACSLANYLRLPRKNCILMQLERSDVSKDKVLAAALKISKISDKKQVIYVGVYCGDWGLSTADKDAAGMCGIDSVSIYHLLGKI